MAGVVTRSPLTGHYHSRITLSVARDAGSLLAGAWLPFLMLALRPGAGDSTATLVTTGAVVAAALVAGALRALLVRARACARGAGSPSARCSSAPAR